MRRPAPTRADHEALRRALEAAGLDPDYFGNEDLQAMWNHGFGIARIVKVAQEMDARNARRSA